MTISVKSHSASTAATTVLDVSNTSWYSQVTVINRSTVAAAVELWVRFDGTAPTVAGDGCYLVPAATIRTFPNIEQPTEPAAGFTGISPMQLISSSICPFSVEFN